MSNDLAISVQNISKAYRIWESPSDRVIAPLLSRLGTLFPPTSRAREYLEHKAVSRYRDFWALQNANFDIRRGESVGILGRNGSGKSTLLQIIAGTLRPSTGSVHVAGRVAALLELGSGFNPEFTGRENVFINASVLGVPPSDISARFEDIAKFADIGDFIDQPVKIYSSGMLMRLAFAVQTALEPEVLIVDEALSVGDEAFSRKCFAQIEKLQKAGCSILLVSHDASSVISICTRAILLEKGKTICDGTPREVVAEYRRRLHSSTVFGRDGTAATPAGNGRAVTANDRSRFDPDIISKTRLEYESNGAVIHDPRIVDLDGNTVNILTQGNDYVYTYQVEFTKAAIGASCAMLFKTIHGFELAGAVTHPAGCSDWDPPTGFKCVAKFHFTCRLAPGVYFCNAGVEALIGDQLGYLHRVVDAFMFRVLPATRPTTATAAVDLLISPCVVANTN